MPSVEVGRTEAVLVFPSKPGIASTMVLGPGLGTAYIAAYLAEKGHSVLPLVSEQPGSTSSYVRRVRELRPAVVGFTVYNTNYYACKALAEALKNALPDTLCIFGGPAPTVVPEAILRDAPSVDACVRGGGEEVLLAILRMLRDHGFRARDAGEEAWRAVAGLHFRCGERIVATPDMDPLVPGDGRAHPLDRYPSPYLRGTLPASAAAYNGVITARGCNQSCTYCNCAVLWNRKIFPHSVDRVLEELDFLSRADDLHGTVQIRDDAFNLLPRRAEEICRGILDNGIRLEMRCLARCDLVTEDLLRLMKEAGFVSLGISLESAVPRVLRAIGKVSPPGTASDPGLTREKGYLDAVRRCVDLARKIGFHSVSASIMVGLPGESVEEARETLRFVEDLGIDFYWHNFLRIYPGTPLFREYGKHGYAMDDFDGLRPFPQTVLPYPAEREVKPIAGLSYDDSSGEHVQTGAVLGLFSVQNREKGSFNNVVVFAEELSEELVAWMKRNLALAGRLVHVFEAPESEPDLRELKKFLYRTVSPTLNYRPYQFLPASGGGPERFRSNRKRTEIRRLPLSAFSPDHIPGPGADFVPLCTLEGPADFRALHRLLQGLEGERDPFLALARHGDFPLVERSCMWLEAGANCLTFETAMIDARGNVRICTRAEPSGTLASPFDDIRASFRAQQAERVRERPCGSCAVRSACTRCAFPRPFAPEAYCAGRRRLGAGSVLEIVHVHQRRLLSRLFAEANLGRGPSPREEKDAS